MNLGLSGKSAVVMASSKGMGRGIALKLAEEGANVALCARGRDDLEKTAAEIRSKSASKIFHRVVDVTKETEVSRFIQDVRAQFGTVHILVNNTGGPPPGTFSELPPEAWSQAVQNLLLSVVHTCREVVPLMKAQKWGRIINVTSMTVKQPSDHLILSNTARTGLVAFAKSLSRELAPHGITVNNLAPGLILTDRIRDLAEVRARKESLPVQTVLERMEEEVPIGRFGSPEDMANMAAFLASESAGYITGNTVLIDGGLYRGLM